MFSIERDVERTPGLHLSHVINYIEYQEGKRSESELRGGISQIGQAYAAGGFLWERVLAHLIENDPLHLWEGLFTAALNEIEYPNVIRPGEQCVDGILMTPDGYNIDEARLEEWKYTTKSSASDIRGPKFRRWVSFQIPSYLHSLGLTECRLRVYFAKGDYKSVVPVWKEFVLTYTEFELEEIWEMIVLNARAMERDGFVDHTAT